MIRVEGIRLNHVGENVVISGRVGEHEIKYSFPASLDVQNRAEPFLAVALLKGMVEGRDIFFDSSAPLDPGLFGKLPHIQATYKLWNPRLSLISVEANLKAPSVHLAGAMSAFSGGVDGAATLSDHMDEVDWLLTLDCYDARKIEERGAMQAKSRNIAHLLGKESIFVSTNVRSVCENLGLSWYYMHGPVPCLLASAFGVSRFYMPSSFTYAELKPWGSHPVLDPLWSTTATEVIHDGGWRRRTEKIALLARNPALLKNLQVCYVSQVDNCGNCPKCVRTTIALAALGVEGAPFPPIDLYAQVGRVTIETDQDAAFAHDLMRILNDTRRPEIAARLGSRLRRFKRRQLLLRLRRNLLDPRLANPLRSLRRRPKRGDRLGIEDPDDAII